MKDIKEHIGRNYNEYVDKIKRTRYYISSLIKDDVYDILNDVIIDILEHYSEEKLYEKLSCKLKNDDYKLNTALDGLIIYVVSLNLVSKTTKFNKKYIDYKTTNYDNFQYNDFLLGSYDIHDYCDKTKLDMIEKALCDIENEYKYPFKIYIYREMWGFDEKTITKKTYKEMAEKYNLDKMTLYKINRDINDLIIKKIIE